jgi:uncharacterized protein (TIGR02300 family)
MPKEEWGVKRVCPTTGKRFYDLNKSPIISPYTGEIVPIEAPGRKGSSVMSDDSARAKPSTAAKIEDDDVLLDDDDVDVVDDEDLLEDDDDDNVSLDDLDNVAADDDE